MRNNVVVGGTVADGGYLFAYRDSESSSNRRLF
jgi:hypothetical protein